MKEALQKGLKHNMHRLLFLRLNFENLHYLSVSFSNNNNHFVEKGAPSKPQNIINFQKGGQSEERTI